MDFNSWKTQVRAARPDLEGSQPNLNVLYEAYSSGISPESFASTLKAPPRKRPEALKWVAFVVILSAAVAGGVRLKGTPPTPVPVAQTPVDPELAYNKAVGKVLDDCGTDAEAMEKALKSGEVAAIVQNADSFVGLADEIDGITPIPPARKPVQKILHQVSEESRVMAGLLREGAQDNRPSQLEEATVHAKKIGELMSQFTALITKPTF